VCNGAKTSDQSPLGKTQTYYTKEGNLGSTQRGEKIVPKPSTPKGTHWGWYFLVCWVGNGRSATKLGKYKI